MGSRASLGWLVIKNIMEDLRKDWLFSKKCCEKFSVCCEFFPVCCEFFPVCCEFFPVCCEYFPDCCEFFPVCCEIFPEIPFAVRWQATRENTQRKFFQNGILKFTSSSCKLWFAESPYLLCRKSRDLIIIWVDQICIISFVIYWNNVIKHTLNMYLYDTKKDAVSELQTHFLTLWHNFRNDVVRLLYIIQYINQVSQITFRKLIDMILILNLHTTWIWNLLCLTKRI